MGPAHCPVHNAHVYTALDEIICTNACCVDHIDSGREESPRREQKLNRHRFEKLPASTLLIKAVNNLLSRAEVSQIGDDSINESPSRKILNRHRFETLPA